MNLHCNRMELRQTPTYITYMCMVQPDGSIPDEVAGLKAKHALQIYSQWIRSSINGPWYDVESLSAARAWLSEELGHLQEVLKSRKKLVVYIL